MRRIGRMMGLILLFGLMGCADQTTRETHAFFDLHVTIDDASLGAVSGGGCYAAEERVRLQIILSEDAIFDGWMIEGIIVSPDTEFYYTMANQEVTITAKVHRTETREIKRLNMLLPPTTHFYYPGQDFSIEGMVVEAEYDNGDKEIIDNDDLVVIPPQFAGERPYSVTVNYEGLSTFFLVFYEESRMEISSLKTLFVLGETVDFFFSVNSDIENQEIYQIEVVNPQIAEAVIDPSNPQHAEITARGTGTTQVRVFTVSRPDLGQTVDVTVVDELPPSVTDTWPGEYLELILHDLSAELTPIGGSSYTFNPEQFYGDYYRFSIQNFDESLDFVAYALEMQDKGWSIVSYEANMASFTKNNVRITISVNEITKEGGIYIVKHGYPIQNLDVKTYLPSIISGQIHEDVSQLVLPDFRFFFYVLSLYSWQHPYSEHIHLFGYCLEDPSFTMEGYADVLLNLGFTELESNDKTWCLDPGGTYMIFLGYNNRDIQIEIQSIDYYEDWNHYLRDLDRYN